MLSFMFSTFSRRDFLKLSPALALSLSTTGARAVDPFLRTGPPRLPLSLAAYSFRQYFKDTSHERERETEPARRIDLFQFVDFCAAHGCAGAELTCYYFPKDVDEAFLLKLRRHCFLRGVAVSGTAVGNTFTHPAGDKRDEQIRYVKQWINHAAVLGAPHIRVFAGNAPRGMSLAEAKKLCLAALEECAEAAGQRGIFLGLENHGGIVAEADDLLEIVRAIRSPWVGINLDSGNFHTDDPYRDFERCAPFAVNVQLKTEIQRRGQKTEAADLARLAKILRSANYQGFVALEYEAEEDPWKAVPGLLKKLADLLRV
jgi:sugar phosphate isomerase/epimerase